MGFFEGYLSLWPALSIILGISLSVAFPDDFAKIAGLEWAHVNLLTARACLIGTPPMFGTVGRCLACIPEQHWQKWSACWLSYP